MEQLSPRLLRTFLAELEDRVGALNRDLLALESVTASAERDELLRNVFRAVHSLKGAASSVGISELEAICHRLEEVVVASRDRRLSFDAPVVQLFLISVDAIEEAGARLAEGKEIATGAIAALLPQLEAAARTGSVSAVPTRIVSPRPVLAQPPDEPIRPLGGSIRLATDKLDALISRSGELLLARRRIASRQSEFDDIRTLVAEWHAEWATYEKRTSDPGSRMPPNPSVTGGAATGQRRYTGGGFVRQAGDNLRRLLSELDRFSQRFAVDQRLLTQAADRLDADIRVARMLPFMEACTALDRAVRDLARAAGKQVRFSVNGGDIELDRSIIDRLRDPLLHLVRNAVDHGIEAPEQRRAAGKPDFGTITVAAVLRGNMIEIAVGDDGRGLDLTAIRQRSARMGLIDGSDDQVARNIFQPGLSTADNVTESSGRGVGLDAVRAAVETMRGVIDVVHEPGQGARFVMMLPLTLTTTRAVLAAAGGETLAIEASSIVKVLRVDPSEIRSVGGREVLTVGEAPIPIVRLAEVVWAEAKNIDVAAPKLATVVIAAGARRVAFVVDALLDEQELVVRNPGPRLQKIPNVSAAAILPTGKVVLVLNSVEIVSAALGQTGGRPSVVPPKKIEQAKKRLLLADDSMTTRALEKSILELAGYDVIAAVDGAEAWRTLQDRGADLVVSDVDMPNMDGFALTQTIRLSNRFKKLPVILVTGKDSAQDRARGLEVGADAYIVKSAFDQRQLLEVIAQLV
jgi:two-component system chemotaxis sensor kinase CheA